MSDPCIEKERIIKTEAVLGEVKEEVKTLREEHGQKLDKLIDQVGELKNNKSFVGGIAATGWVIGAMTIDLVKPLAKPIAAALLATIR